MPFYSVLADVLGFQRPSEFNIAQDVDILSKVDDSDFRTTALWCVIVHYVDYPAGMNTFRFSL